MRFPRHWNILVLVSWLALGTESLLGQETPATGGSGDGAAAGGTSGGSSGFGVPASSFGSPPPSGSPTTSAPSAGTPSTDFGSPSSAFGTPTPENPTLPTNPSGFTSPSSGAPTTTSPFTGGPQGGALPPAQSTSFSFSPGYGQPSQTFIPGQGVLAKPHFTYTAGLSIGYDDNTLTTPFNSVTVKEVTERVETQPAIPTHIVIVQRTLPRGGGTNQPRPTFPVLVQATPAKFETVVLSPGVPATSPSPSFAARASASTAVQFASSRSLFTLNAAGSTTYLPSRPGDASDFSGSLAAGYIYRFTPRLQFTAAVNVAYQTQPNLQQVNGPTNNPGNYLTTNDKIDLSYRWNSRFSTVTSVSYNSNIYESQLESANNFSTITLGTEARYLLNPKVTGVGEIRYERDLFDSDPTRNSNSYFLLAGGDITLSRRLSGTLRAGLEMRTFDEGESSLSPYVESTLSYRYNRAGLVTWNTRVGFEAPPGPSSTSEVLRSTISAIQGFSARTRGTLSFSAVHNLITDNVTNTETVQNTFGIDLGLEYSLNRHTSLTADYSFINELTSYAGGDYIRNQIFFGIQYAF